MIIIKNKFIPISKPTLGIEEQKAVREVIASGFISKSKKTKEVEELFCKIFNRKYSVLTTSGTASLNTALYILGMGKGDEVITTPLTFMATASSTIYSGARVVFADIDPITYNINPEEIEKRITKKTKAIIAVDLYGHPIDYDKIRVIAGKHNLYLIEDAAQAHGALYKNKPAGSLGDISIFSFYGSKIVTSGEGGAILTNSKKFYEASRSHIAHGTKEGNPYVHLKVGYNYIPTDIQAAILIEQLKKLNKFVNIRNKIAKYYSNRLQGIDGIQLPKVENYIKHAFLCYTIRINSKLANRDKVLNSLNKQGVGARVYYPVPLHLQPVWKKLGYNFKKGDYPKAEKACKEILSLPMFPTLKKFQLEKIISVLTKILDSSSKI